MKWSLLPITLLAFLVACTPTQIDAFCRAYKPEDLQFRKVVIRAMNADEQSRYLQLLEGTKVLCKGVPGW